MQTGSRFVY